MAMQPWVTPKEVKDYTDNSKVKKRSNAKLAVDIFRAERYVIKYTNNSFADSKVYPTAPDSVRLAVVLLAEMYASSAVDVDTNSGNFRSETFDDYSYTLADTAKKQENIDLGPLLDEYVLAAARNAVEMKLRRL